MGRFLRQFRAVFVAGREYRATGGVIASADETSVCNGAGVLAMMEQMISKERRWKEAVPLIVDAAEKGDVRALQVQLQEWSEKLFSASPVDADGFLPLHKAALAGHTEAVKLLLVNKCPVDIPDLRGWTALVFAIDGNHQETAELLVKFGSNLKQQGLAALQRAVAREHIPLCKWLLSECKLSLDTVLNAGGGASDQKKGFSDRDGARYSYGSTVGTALMFTAVEHCRPAMISFLLEQRADVNGQVNTNSLLHLCARNANMLPLIKMIVAHGAKVSHCNSSGLTPLHEAVRRGLLPTAELLLESKGEVSGATRAGQSLLHLAAEASSGPIVRLLVQKHGLNLKGRDKAGRTPLMCAANTGQTEGVRALAELKADLELCDREGATAFMLACTNCWHPTLLYLAEEARANPAATLKHKSAMRQVGDLGQWPTLEFMVSNGIPVDDSVCNAVADDDNTAQLEGIRKSVARGKEKHRVRLAILEIQQVDILLPNVLWDLVISYYA